MEKGAGITTARGRLTAADIARREAEIAAGIIQPAVATPLQTGGHIEREGLAYVHAGETVVPPGRTSEVTNIFIEINTGPIYHDGDITDMAEKVAMAVASKRSGL